MSENPFDDHFPAAVKHDFTINLSTNYSDETARMNSMAAGDLTAQERPERTQEMVRKGQVWVGMNYPDGSKGWEVRGTGALIDREPIT